MEDSDKALPVLGIGPFYLLSCLILMLIGFKLKNNQLFKIGDISKMKTPLMFIGSIFIVVGVAVWIYAVIIQKISEEIKNGKLITKGIYSFVRNPIYTAFIFVFTGILIMGSNLFLLILPILFWINLTVILKLTEEKWLLEKFGDEYVDYCKVVNRIIPWFPKK
jgi:hypothetical protein